MAKMISGTDADFKKVVKQIKEKLHKEEHRQLLRNIANNGGYITHDDMKEFADVFGQDWIVWVKCYSGFKYCITVEEYFKIDREEIKSLDDFKTPNAINTYKEMIDDYENVDFSKYDFRQDIREVYISSNHYEYFVF
jgi:hypothetical protein